MIGVVPYLAGNSQVLREPIMTSRVSLPRCVQKVLINRAARQWSSSWCSNHLEIYFTIHMYFSSNNSIFPTHWFKILLNVFVLNETKIEEQPTSWFKSLANKNLYTLSSLQWKIGKSLSMMTWYLFPKNDIKEHTKAPKKIIKS